MVYKKDLHTIVNDICAENNIPTSEPIPTKATKYSLVEVYDRETKNARIVVQNPEGEILLPDKDWDNVKDNVDEVYSMIAQKIVSNSAGELSVENISRSINSRGITAETKDDNQYEVENVEITEEAQKVILENPGVLFNDLTTEYGRSTTTETDLPSRLRLKNTDFKRVVKRKETLLEKYLNGLNEERQEQVKPILDELGHVIEQNAQQKGIYTDRDDEISDFVYQYFISDSLAEDTKKTNPGFDIVRKGYEVIKHVLNSAENDAGDAATLTLGVQDYLQQRAVETGESNIVEAASALAQWGQFALAHDYHNRNKGDSSILLSKSAGNYTTWKDQVPKTNNSGERRFLNALTFLAAGENLEETMSLRRANFLKDELGETNRVGTQLNNLTGHIPDLSYSTFLTERSPLIHLGHRLNEYVATLGEENIESAVRDLGHGEIKSVDLTEASNELISIANESDVNQVFTNLGGNKPLCTKEKSHLTNYIVPTLLAYETMKGRLGYNGNK